MAKKSLNLPLFGTGNPNIFRLSAVFARKNSPIRSGSYRVLLVSLLFMFVSVSSSMGYLILLWHSLNLLLVYLLKE